MAKKSLFILSLSIAVLIPTLALGVGFTDAVNVVSFTQLGNSLLSIMWVVLAIFAVVCFIIAGIMFLTAMGDPTKLKIARSAVIFGMVGVAVGILAYSVVTIVASMI